VSKSYVTPKKVWNIPLLTFPASFCEKMYEKPNKSYLTDRLDTGNERAFVDLEPVQRSEDGCDNRRFRSLNHSTCKTVLNLLEAVYLRFGKIVVERLTVVKFRVDNRGSDTTDCFRTEVRRDTASGRIMA